MIITSRPEKVVKKKKEKTWSLGMANINTAINLISPAPIIFRLNNKKPINNATNAGITNIFPYWIQANGTITKNKYKIILLTIKSKLNKAIK